MQGITWIYLEFYLCAKQILRESIQNHHSFDDLKRSVL